MTSGCKSGLDREWTSLTRGLINCCGVMWELHKLCGKVEVNNYYLYCGQTFGKMGNCVIMVLNLIALFQKKPQKCELMMKHTYTCTKCIKIIAACEFWNIPRQTIIKNYTSDYLNSYVQAHCFCFVQCTLPLFT